MEEGEGFGPQARGRRGLQDGEGLLLRVFVRGGRYFREGCASYKSSDTLTDRETDG